MLEKTPFQEPTLTVKPQLNNFIKTTNKAPLQDITNYFNAEDEAPKPLALKSRPTPVHHPSYERNSLSMRANMK